MAVALNCAPDTCVTPVGTLPHLATDEPAVVADAYGRSRRVARASSWTEPGDRSLRARINVPGAGCP